VFGVVACHVDADDFKHSMVLQKPWRPDVHAPEGDSESETRLYQLLYVGEAGDTAHALGQRVRMMAWLRTVRLSDENLTGLARLGVMAQQKMREDRAARAVVDAREAELVAPIYARLETALADPGVTVATLETLSKELVVARETLDAEGDAVQEYRDRVRSIVLETALWMSVLTPEQRTAVGGCRFVLTEHAAPLTNPGSYASLVGMIWDRGDFSALQMGDEITADGPLDIGGLWALEHLRAPPSGYMVESARAGMLMLVILDPAFLPSIQAVMAGRGLDWARVEETGADADGEASAP